MKITIFGDSLTNGYNAMTQEASDVLKVKIEKLAPELLVTLQGVNGEDTYDGLRRLDAVTTISSDKMFIFFGTNDSSTAHEVNTEEYAVNLRQMVQTIGEEKTILITPAYFNEKVENPFRSKQLVELYREKTLAVAEEFDLVVVDLYEKMKESVNPVELLQFDGLHLSEAGYDMLAELIVQILENMEEKENE